MNMEAQVLQALDGVQQDFIRLRNVTGEERGRVAREALQRVNAAPWSSVLRTDERSSTDGSPGSARC